MLKGLSLSFSPCTACRSRIPFWPRALQRAMFFRSTPEAPTTCRIQPIMPKGTLTPFGAAIWLKKIRAIGFLLVPLRPLAFCTLPGSLVPLLVTLFCLTVFLLFLAFSLSRTIFPSTFVFVLVVFSGSIFVFGFWLICLFFRLC